MPFRSESQRKWMWANHPEMAKHWQAVTPKNAKLPEHVAKQKHAAFVDELLDIMAEKSAPLEKHAIELLAPLARYQYTPEVRRDIKKVDSIPRRIINRLDRLYGERPEGPSFIERMGTDVA